ncbi:MAG: putative molybdenum carrier protein [Methylohalobius crimeensis]
MTADSAMVYLQRIVSGGQTGADRAALDWALGANIEHGGWCPRGRLAEDGTIPRRYRLQETPSNDYALRTEWNVRDSDATVMLSLHDAVAGGTELTRKLALAYRKPCLHVHADMGVQVAAARLRDFVLKHGVNVLNVAGPRASEAPGIEQFVAEVLNTAFPRYG